MIIPGTAVQPFLRERFRGRNVGDRAAKLVVGNGDAMNELKHRYDHRSPLLLQFREFYAEVVRLKDIIRSGPKAAPLPSQTGQGPESGDFSESISRRLVSLLERQALEADRSGGAFAYERFQEARYVMAGLADEIFLHLDWVGRANWNLLEFQLFQSHSAGDVVFERLDNLLQRQDPVNVDLAAIYLLALSLGFQGKFRGRQGGQIERYRHRLFSMMNGCAPESLDDTTRLFPDCYLHTLQTAAVKKLPDPRLWWLLLPAVILLWVAVSHGLWGHLTDELDAVANRIGRIAQK